MNGTRSASEAWTFSRSAFIILMMLLLASLALTLVILIPPAASLTSVFYDFSVQVGLLLVIFLALDFAKKGILWEAVSLILILVLFSLPLIYKWQTAKFDGVIFGGLLPWADANGYYTGAQRLMEGSYLTEFATRRPLFTGFFTILLVATGKNLQASLAVLAALNGLATFLAAREIQKAHNAFVAAGFVAICYWYYCAIAGTVMTENLGFCFGSLALAFLIRGVEKNQLGQIGYGLFLLTIALSIRAGAFFILPALLLWVGLMYKRESGWKGIVLVGMAVVVALTSNMIFKKVIGNPNGVLFSNYSYTLYGLASGNAGWKQVSIDFPDVKENEIFGLAINKIKSDPALLGLGMMRAFQDYFSMGNGGFSFLRLIHDKNLGNHILWILTWLGLGTVLFSPKRSLSWMILFAFLGILASTLLVPPNDADSMRVYAATIPFTAYLAALGLLLPELLTKKIGFPYPASATEWKTDVFLFPFSLGLLLVCLLFPLTLRIIRHPLNAGNPLACSPDETPVLFLMENGSTIRLIGDSEARESYLPTLQLTNFRSQTEAGPGFYPFLTRELVNLEPGSAISVGGFRKITFPASDPIETGYLITNGQPLEPGPHQICVRPAEDENLRATFFYFSSTSENAKQDLSFLQKYPYLTDAIRGSYELVLLLITLGFFEFWSLGPARKLFVFGNILLIIVGILVALHSAAIYPLTWERKSLPTENATHVEGYSYKINLGIHWMDRKLLRDAPVIVYEDGSALKHPNDLLFNIKQRGKGRYSIENGYLFLSASDNSNPQQNGRTYEIYWPTPIPTLYQYGFYLSLLVGVFFLVRYSPKLLW